MLIVIPCLIVYSLQKLKWNQIQIAHYITLYTIWRWGHLAYVLLIISIYSSFAENRQLHFVTVRLPFTNSKWVTIYCWNSKKPHKIFNILLWMYEQKCFSHDSIYGHWVEKYESTEIENLNAKYLGASSDIIILLVTSVSFASKVINWLSVLGQSCYAPCTK